jgi:peptidoglycan hydrolase CwlO-like protein
MESADSTIKSLLAAISVVQENINNTQANVEVATATLKYHKDQLTSLKGQLTKHKNHCIELLTALYIEDDTSAVEDNDVITVE